MNVFLYTDGSFSKSSGYGIGGYLIFVDSTDHESGDVSKAALITEKICEKNNIRVELKIAIQGLIAAEAACRTDTSLDDTAPAITLYTDCKTIVGLPDRRKRLEASCFNSKRRGTRLSNADLYLRFFAIWDKTHPRISWVKGHAPGQGNSAVEKNFRYVDKTIRKLLRDSLP